jgi:cysteinyl-tRNA synthetase
LSRQNPQDLKKGARVDFIKGKKHVSDFALWKYSPKDEKRQMEWGSPWGVGFPGWHIECSAMGMKALGESFDIHTGGIDHINIHHTNEIAQSEAATGKQFVKYWVHHNFLVVNGEKMSKSLNNFYTVEDVIKKGYDPLALRYLYLQTHYRQEMNFTWESLDGAQIAYKKLINDAANWDSPKIGCAEYEERFIEAVNDDLNMSKALGIMWELIKSDYPTSAKSETLGKFDQVLGLKIFAKRKIEEIPQNILNLVNVREGFRKAGDFAASDEIRNKIHDLGYDIKDTKGRPIVTKI